MWNQQVSLLLLSVSCMSAEGEKVEIVDFSDLAIYDVFNNSFLAMFDADNVFTGKISNKLSRNIMYKRILK